jgi:hypothetical protein
VIESASADGELRVGLEAQPPTTMAQSSAGRAMRI